MLQQNRFYTIRRCFATKILIIFDAACSIYILPPCAKASAPGSPGCQFPRGGNQQLQKWLVMSAQGGWSRRAICCCCLAAHLTEFNSLSLDFFFVLHLTFSFPILHVLLDMGFFCLIMDGCSLSHWPLLFTTYFLDLEKFEKLLLPYRPYYEWCYDYVRYSWWYSLP